VNLKQGTTMSPDFQSLMLEATRLTRSGHLAAAQAAIQAALGGASAPGGPAAAPTGMTHPMPFHMPMPPMPMARPASTFSPKPTPTPAPTHAPTPRPQSLRETIDVLARVIGEPGAPLPQGLRPAAPGGPCGPCGPGMTAGHHAAAGLGCDYQLFVPPSRPTGAPPPALVVMLHGCTQHPADFAAGTRMNELAREQGFIVLYPAQSRRMNPQGCWNWFKHSHQRRGHGEPALLASLTREVMQQHGVDPARVYVAGLSAGGAMAAVLGRCYPELYAAVGVHSGLAAGVARDLPSALAAMNGAAGPAPMQADGKPVIVFHGDADTTVHPLNAATVVAASTTAPPAAEAVAAADRPGQRRSTRRVHRGPDGRVIAEHWTVHGAAHAWSGGSPAGSYTDPAGPDASAAMWRFFQQHPQAVPGDGEPGAVH
jgi:poly(hydroxyalkanoate) depolymerase family esterase